MHPREARAIAREAVPGSGEPTLIRLGSGLLNDTYRVDRGGRTFSMRVAAASSRVSRLDREWELEVLREAARRSLAPPLVCGDAERGFLVQEWVAGRPWPAASVREAANIARMADLLHRVHELPQPNPALVKRPRAWIEHYAAALTVAGLAAPAAPLAAAAADRLASLEALPEPSYVVCHSDLHLMNLLESPLPASASGSLTLLDWEYAHVSEPFWDLAGWSANNDFSEPLLRGLLRAYLGRAPHPLEWTRCKLLVWLYDYVCLLWSKLYLDSRSGTGPGKGRPDSAADPMGRPGIAARVRVLSERLSDD
jgi:aminoglycoside phosphotransferase (APT) family kinase protein